MGTQELAASYSISIIYQMLSNFNLKGEAEQLKQWLEKYVEQAASKLQQYTG